MRDNSGRGRDGTKRGSSRTGSCYGTRWCRMGLLINSDAVQYPDPNKMDYVDNCGNDNANKNNIADYQVTAGSDIGR